MDVQKEKNDRMVKTKEEILKSLKERIGEDNSDEALQFIEDVTDTLDELTKEPDGEDWKKKYEENDAEWRKRYKERFFSGEMTPPVKLDTDGQDEEDKPLTYDSLFETKEK